MLQKIRPNWPKIIVNILAFIPLLWLIVSWFTNNLGPNPVKYVQLFTGDVALIMLLLSLSATPLKKLTGFAPIGKFKKTFGLQAFYYATVHLINFLWIDYRFDWKAILDLVIQKWYLLLGLISFLILLALAITSLKKMKVLLGKNWKPLHRLVYLAGILAVLHYGLSVKGSLFLLRGNIGRPLLAGAILTVLLVSRLPFKCWFSHKKEENEKPRDIINSAMKHDG